MKYHELQVKSHSSRRRVGRGIAAGQGKTAGRGTKGQKSRTGKGRRPGFEGGQNPLMQKIPKLRGFRSARPTVETVYTGQLDDLGTTIDNFTLADAGLISSPYVKVKLIVKGNVAKKHTVKVQLTSLTAAEALQKLGGSFSSVPQVKRTAKQNTTDQ